VSCHATLRSVFTRVEIIKKVIYFRDFKYDCVIGRAMLERAARVATAVLLIACTHRTATNSDETPGSGTGGSASANGGSNATATGGASSGTSGGTTNGGTSGSTGASSTGNQASSGGGTALSTGGGGGGVSAAGGAGGANAGNGGQGPFPDPPGTVVGPCAGRTGATQGAERRRKAWPATVGT
jgi:hypothetical protein